MQSLETKVELSDYGSVAASVLVDQEKLNFGWWLWDFLVKIALVIWHTYVT